MTLAATVVLLRDGEHGLEVFMVVRASTMAFGAGAAVFPGGKVDVSDSDLLEDDPLACQKIAALRETFEEVGALFALHNGEPLSAQALEGLQTWRSKLDKHKVSFSEFCAANGLEPDDTKLHPIARWMTPEGAKRQFDTYFFAAAMPEGQNLEHDGHEAVASDWFQPAQALGLFERGEMSLMPPTLWTLKDLAGYDTVASALDGLTLEDVPLSRPYMVEKEGERFIIVDGREPMPAAKIVSAIG